MTSCLHNLKERSKSNLYIPLFLGYCSLLFTGACKYEATGIFTVLRVRIGVRLGAPDSHRLSYPYFLRVFTYYIESGRNKTKLKEYNTI